MDATSSTLGSIARGLTGEERPSRVRADPDHDVRRLLTAGEVRAAVELLMRRHGESVYRYCCGALRDDGLAEQVLEQVFVDAHAQVRRMAREDTRSRIWIFGIARRRVLAAVRDARGGQRPSGAADSRPAGDAAAREGGAGDGAAGVLRIDDAALRGALAGCLDQVGEHVRTALLLRYQQGFSFDEMAEICREKPRKLRERVALALPALRRCIERRTGGRL
jgi:RNA polymerase sigma-70 factor (ECF subfamily)